MGVSLGINMNWTGIDHRTHSYHVSDRLIQYPGQLCMQTNEKIVERSSLLSLENKSIPLPLPPTPYPRLFKGKGPPPSHFMGTYRNNGGRLL